MFYKYEIKKINNSDTLLLYFTMNYEFSNELSKISNKNSSIKQEIKKYINDHNIKFNGKKVYLITNGIIIKALDVSEIEDKQKVNDINKYSNDKYIINLHYNNSVVTVSMRTYLLGALATSAVQNLQLTAIKALALLFRTYAYDMMDSNNLVLSINKYILYKPIEYYKLIWKDEYQYNYNRINKAITDTEGEFITYNDKYILPFFHICSNGFTSSDTKYPYLERVDSIWDYTYKYYLSYKDFSLDTLAKILMVKKESLKNVNLLETTKSNHIKKIKIADKVFSGDDFKQLLKLNSSDINIIINPTYMRIITKGIGSNLGLSEFGANELAKVGCSYMKIIQYYFPKVIVKKYLKA